MKKFLSSRTNQIRILILLFGCVIFGIGAYIGIELLQKRNEQNNNDSATSTSKEDSSNNNEETDSNSSSTTKVSTMVPSASPIQSTTTTTIAPSSSVTIAASDRLTSIGQEVSISPTVTSSDATTEMNSTTTNSSTSTGGEDGGVVVDNNNTNITIFYAIGDVPYTDLQHVQLAGQIANIPSDAEFVIHVGDMRKSGPKIPCQEYEYSSVSATLQTSKVPVFIVLGDNDWNDCPNPDEGLQYWENEFQHFDSKHWNHTFNVTHQSNRPNNFAFVHKHTLYIGLTLVGGSPIDSTEWTERLVDQADWVIEQIMSLLQQSQPRIPRVVIFGHANPKSNHEPFFAPITDFIQTTLQNVVPVLYLCGDRHRWLHQPNYFDQPSFTRIMLTGKTFDPPLKVIVNATLPSFDPLAFMYDRMLPPGHVVMYDDDEYADPTDTDDDLVFGTDDLVIAATTQGTNDRFILRRHN